MNIFQAECLQLLTRQGRYVADSEVVVGNRLGGSRREEQIPRRCAPRDDKRGRGERGAGWAALRFGSLPFTLLIWGGAFVKLGGWLRFRLSCLLLPGLTHRPVRG